MLEPAFWKLVAPVRHVLAAKHAEGKHLLRRQLRFELRIEVVAHPRRKFVAISGPHPVIHRDKPAFPPS